MTARRGAFLAVLALTLLVGIFDHDLWTPDEPRAAEMGREFLDHASWSVPTLNDRPFVEKPPLVYWMIGGSLKVFGTKDWAARLPAVLLGAGTLLFTGLLTRAIYGGGVAEPAVLVLSSMVGFLVAGHHMESDSGLLFFVTASAYFLWRAIDGSPHWYGAAMLAVLGAFFSKGLIGIAFPALLIFTWVGWTKRPGELLRARPWIWLPLLAIPISLWLFSIARDPRGDLLHEFLVDNHLRRFLGATGDEDRGHRQPIYAYLLEFPLAVLPWTPGLLWAVPGIWSRRRERPERFLLSWFLPGFLLLTLAGTKRAIYLVPLLPPVAILVAERISRSRVRSWLEPGLLGLTLALAVAWILIAPRVDATRSFGPFCRELPGRLPAGAALYGYDLDETARAVVPFYTGRYLAPLRKPEDLDLLARTGSAKVVVVTVDIRGNPWHSNAVRARFPYLLLAMPEDRAHRMVVLGSSPSSP